MDPRVQGGRPQNDAYGQKGRPLENLYQQRGKQPAEEQFGEQRGRQDDSSAVQQQRRGKQPILEEQKSFGGQRGWGEDPFARGKQQQQIQDPFAGQRGNLGDPFRSISPSSVQESSPKYQESTTRLQTAKEPYAQLELDETDKPAPSYYGGHAELHEAPGPGVNPALTTMVKMVTMLNFMKVDLGETKSLKSKEQWRAAGAEFIGTLLFVYLGCGSVVATGMLDPTMTPARLVAIALAHGLAISFLAGATGAISGGHLNPAVTLAFVVAGKENLLRAGLYVGSQILGAIFGALFLKWCTPESVRGTLGSHDVNPIIFGSQAFLMELILTFVLIFVIFGVAVDRRGPGVIAPIPIGFAVVVDHLVGVPYTGASMNPARSFGPAIVSGAFGSQHLIYWAAPGFGATLASALYRYAFLEPAEAAIVASHPTTSKETGRF